MRWLNGMLVIWPEDGLEWPTSLRPYGHDTMDPEAVDTWYERNQSLVGHLHPLIAGQWIHRHWTHSPYCSFPLGALSWTMEIWASEKLLGVHCPRCMMNAEHDFDVFNTFPGNPTAAPMNATGTWDIPVLILEIPGGVVDAQGPVPTARHLLIEGHQRMRYLNALVARDRVRPEHRVFVLRLQQLRA